MRTPNARSKAKTFSNRLFFCYWAKLEGAKVLKGEYQAEKNVSPKAACIKFLSDFSNLCDEDIQYMADICQKAYLKRFEATLLDQGNDSDLPHQTAKSYAVRALLGDLPKEMANILKDRKYEDLADRVSNEIYEGALYSTLTKNINNIVDGVH